MAVLSGTSYADSEYYRGKIVYLTNTLVDFVNEVQTFVANYNALPSATKTNIQNFLTTDGTWSLLQAQLTALQSVTLPTVNSSPMVKISPDVML